MFIDIRNPYHHFEICFWSLSPSTTTTTTTRTTTSTSWAPQRIQVCHGTFFKDGTQVSWAEGMLFFNTTAAFRVWIGLISLYHNTKTCWLAAPITAKSKHINCLSHKWHFQLIRLGVAFIISNGLTQPLKIRCNIDDTLMRWNKVSERLDPMYRREELHEKEGFQFHFSIMNAYNSLDGMSQHTWSYLIQYLTPSYLIDSLLYHLYIPYISYAFGINDDDF